MREKFRDTENRYLLLLKEKGFLLVACLFWFTYSMLMLIGSMRIDFGERNDLARTLIFNMTRFSWIAFALAVCFLNWLLAECNYSRNGLGTCIVSLFLLAVFMMANEIMPMSEIRMTMIMIGMISFASCMWCWRHNC